MSNRTLTIVLLVGAVAILGSYFYPQSTSQIVQQLVGSSTGTTFNTAKYAGIVFAPSSGTATSTSILNSDSFDRIVMATEIGCNSIGTSKTAYTGTGLAALTITTGTTSTSAPNSITAPFPVLNAFTVPTSTPTWVLASTSPQTSTTTAAAFWPSGSYFSFATNATNTAVCTVGVRYIGS